jgi:Ca2+-binding RTX toxin-like protein
MKITYQKAPIISTFILTWSIRTAALTVCATATLSGALASATASPATTQNLSGCFLNGREIPSFQADSGIIGTRDPDVIDCTNSLKGRTIFGSNGDDTIIGSRFDDSIHGDSGNDTIRGDAGNDFIAGDNGNDQCSGGSGTDTASTCETVTDVP